MKPCRVAVGGVAECAMAIRTIGNRPLNIRTVNTSTAPGALAGEFPTHEESNTR